MSVISLDEWRKKQALISGSKSQSSLNTVWEELGVTPTDKDLPLYLLVVHHLHKLMIGQYNQRTMSMMQMTVVKAEL